LLGSALIDPVRLKMIEEINRDEASGRLYISSYLTQQGQGQWADVLREAARFGTDDSLAQTIIANGMLNKQAQRKKPKGGYTWVDIPHNASQVLAEAEYNNFFCRGLSSYAIDQGIQRLQVYRARYSKNPRQESEQKIGLLVEPTTILTDLRVSQGVESALGIPPGPGSGISLRIPK
ncbi:hypothetical protein, partial [Rhodoplanes sp. SY1]|uniref:hypothetical protein n=1 Tax=Rhodoplanes sp. SY1 TaxID=3166646 RepID=UPI0038B428B4